MKPIRAEALTVSNAELLCEHSTVDRPLSFLNSSGKTMGSSGTGTSSTSFNVRNLATKAIQSATPKTGAGVQPLAENRSSERAPNARVLSSKVPRGRPELTKNHSEEKTVTSDYSSHSPVANSNTQFEFSETLTKLDSFKYIAPLAFDQTNSLNGEPKAELKREDMIKAMLASDIIQDGHIDTEPGSSISGTIQCRWPNDTHDRTNMAPAKTSPEEDFGWDRDMDDALGQLDHIEAPANPELQGMDHLIDGKFAGVDLGLEWNYQGPWQTMGDIGNTRGGDEVDMDGDMDDEDLIALPVGHHDLGHSYTESENTKMLGGYSSAGHPEAFSGAFYYSLGKNSDGEEEFSFGMGVVTDVTQLPGTTERFSPPSSLQYPFDDSSQTLEVYDSNLRGSSPPTGENPVSDNVMFTTNTQYEASISAANTPPGGDSHGITGQTAEVVDRTLAIVDDRGPGPTDPNALSLPTDIPDGSTKNPKIRVRIPNSPETPEPSALLKSKLPPHLLEYNASGQPKPFVRPAFPERVQDRSPIVGLSNKTFLRTCFRIGEAICAGSHAGRWGQDAVIELYARVVFSSRGDWKQHFQFADLFHDRPPFLNGTYEVFHGVELWERDSGRFLTEEGKGKMCRCLGRMRRDGHGWKLVVLNIWEATWDDVVWVKGIVCA
ncbi:hypothetical protein FGG08_000664 [Glutinoglossum americanum]|uniref:Uncharacterized protein n=1 Tax=Glutinoglossum americanum TaxID=1670608 RepID=A0A9P8ICP9_9PEZI|nr:hypothetical protein FGG08_000664 [Glutinoglossum americanum]